MITICIPFYNDMKFLRHSILSVINQTYTNWELLLLDDGSTDGSLDIAKEYCLDPRIKLISDGMNKGLVYRLNQSIELTKTDYYVRMDSDDIMHPDRLLKQIDIMRNNQYIDVLGTTAISIDENNKINGIKQSIFLRDSDRLNKTLGFIHPTIIGKTKWFKKNRYLSTANRMEDTELWYRTRNNSAFYVLNEPLLFYREFGGNYYKKYYSITKTLFTLSFSSLVNLRYSCHWFIEAVYSIPKLILYYLFSVIGKESWLLTRRYKSLSKSKITHFDNILKNVLSEKTN